MKSIRKRTLALMLAVTVTAGAMVPTASAITIPAAVDETYYATLDYYGGMKEGSVVKSYRLNGAASVTDYGVYDEVVNLSDSLSPTVNGNTVTFELGEDAPEKFYFEGKTQKPFEELPWNISVSYKLNGTPILAEDLAGRTGLVEIALDVALNPRASEYSRTNLVLTAAAAFNDDDITSLEAPGAEVQMVGNLRAVLFMVLPGEERHFVIRVGSEDFSFSGLILLAVPATLQQLEQVEDLREAKEKGEDSLEAIGDSMDAILDAMEGMSGSLNAAAGGLDQLNGARGTVSGGKEGVYDRTDLALADLNALADALGKMDPYTEVAAQGIDEAIDSVNGLHGVLQGLRPSLEETRDDIEALQKDAAALREMVETVEKYNDEKTRKLIKNLSSDANGLDDDMEELSDALDDLRMAVNRLGNISTVSASELTGGMTVTVGGQEMTVAQVQEAVETAKELQKGYQDYAKQVVAAGGSTPTMEDFLKYYVATQAGLPSWDAVAGLPPENQAALGEKVQEAATLLQTMSDPSIQAKLQEMEESLGVVNAALPPLNKRIREANGIINGIKGPTADLLLVLQDLSQTLGDKGFTDDLQQLMELCADMMEDLEPHSGDLSQLLKDADKVGDLLSDLTRRGDEAIDRLDGLNDVLNAYEPQTLTALADLRTLSGSLQSTLHDTAGALTAAEKLLRTSGPQLDAGTRNTLSGVSESLRKATAGLDEIDTIRNAKDTIKTLVDDEWDSHTGEVDGLLNIDAAADPVSMTDPRNPTPGSIQYVMRTQEIKAEDEAEETAQQEEAPATTFWGRVAAMFRGIWDGFKKLLHIG